MSGAPSHISLCLGNTEVCTPIAVNLEFYLATCDSSKRHLCIRVWSGHSWPPCHHCNGWTGV